MEFLDLYVVSGSVWIDFVLLQQTNLTTKSHENFEKIHKMFRVF